MTDTAELIEPCPHCGPGNSIVELGQFQLPLPYWQVICGACGSSSGTIPDGERWPNARQLVLDNWNKRYYASRLSALQAENESLKQRNALQASALEVAIETEARLRGALGNAKSYIDALPIQSQEGYRGIKAVIRSALEASQ